MVGHFWHDSTRRHRLRLQRTRDLTVCSGQAARDRGRTDAARLGVRCDQGLFDRRGARNSVIVFFGVAGDVAGRLAWIASQVSMQKYITEVGTRLALPRLHTPRAFVGHHLWNLAPPVLK